MSTADRIQQARLKLGLEPADVARKVGLPTAHYYDLEGREDDLCSTISIAQALKLSAALNTTVPTLLWGEIGPAAEPLINLATRVRVRLADGSPCKEDIPWDPEPLFGGIGCTLTQPIDFLKDLADWVGEDWRPYVVFLAESAPEN